MKRACVVLRRTHPNYTYWQHFEAGFKRLGFAVSDDPKTPRSSDVLLIWNRYPHHERFVHAHEAVGATVIVAENGWIGKIDKHKTIALARSHHNGAGWWPEGLEDRWPRCGVELAEWRTSGEHILVLPQRGYGEAGVGMPSSWLAMALIRLRHATRRPLILRQHPGMHGPPDPDFSGAWAAATWGSGAAIKALAAGVPVFFDMPNWIGASAARQGFDGIEEPFLGDRLPMFQRLAWAQWSPVEIATGEPLARLIECAPAS